MATTLVNITLNRDACVGYGECIGEEPDAVDLDADGTAVLLVNSLPADRAKRLCDSCPTGAIRIAR